jgi:hypothetical protein
LAKSIVSSPCSSGGSSGWSAPVPGRHVRAAQRRLHPRAELAHGERLGDVVVGAQLQPDHLVDLLGLRREHDDRHRAARPQAPAHLQPVELGKHHVEHHEVEGLLGEAVQRLAPVPRVHHLVAVLTQRERQERLDRLLVVYEQDSSGSIGHGYETA